MRLLRCANAAAPASVAYAQLAQLALVASLCATSMGNAVAQSPLALDAPVELEGDTLQGRTDQETILEGRAVMRKGNTRIQADRLEYNQSTDQARAIGNVRVEREGNIYSGPLLEIKVQRFEGHFDQPAYEFTKSEAHGDADRAEFRDASHAVVYNATYTTCPRVPGAQWMPDWILRAASITLDNAEEVGVANGAVLLFKDVPILPVPGISFPLTDKRKSGVLPPTIGVDNVNGVEVVVPYYWNIAPNRDATITPTFMTTRGMDVGGEFRYLETTYNGTLRANYMGNDTLRAADRWGVSLKHNGSVDTSLSEVGKVDVALTLNRVSDDNYWRDFTRSSSSLTQRLLPNSLDATWARNDWSAYARAARWQTLQDPAAPIVPPYDRVPQMGARFARQNLQGWDVGVDADFTQFEADRQLTLQPNAQRAYTQMQISRPWQGAAGFVTPKLQLHSASYQFDAALANGNTSAVSTVPTFSLDSGLVLEREAHFLGRDLVQTLEPRAFYVLTPYRDQSGLPNYDTGATDFNFASIYTENPYVGHDKIADNNMLTLGVSTRFLDAQTGAQYARFGVAQRLRFEDQRVTLNNTSAPAVAGVSDILLGASVNVNDHWALDSTAQYNVRTEQSVRSTVGARFSPSSYRVVNAAYRFQRDTSEQIDLSWQWPLNDLWGDRGQDMGYGRGQGSGRYYSVGRLNYSMDERRLVDTVFGVEYDAGCWLARWVLERVQTSASTATERLMFQIEFVGFTRLGVDPLSTLTQNISRYQNLRDRAGNADQRLP